MTFFQVSSHVGDGRCAKRAGLEFAGGFESGVRLKMAGQVMLSAECERAQAAGMGEVTSGRRGGVNSGQALHVDLSVNEEKAGG